MAVLWLNIEVISARKEGGCELKVAKHPWLSLKSLTKRLCQSENFGV
jgi:hypothetical protein